MPLDELKNEYKLGDYIALLSKDTTIKPIFGQYLGFLNLKSVNVKLHDGTKKTFGSKTIIKLSKDQIVKYKNKYFNTIVSE